MTIMQPGTGSLASVRVSLTGQAASLPIVCAQLTVCGGRACDWGAHACSWAAALGLTHTSSQRGPMSAGSLPSGQFMLHAHLSILVHRHKSVLLPTDAQRLHRSFVHIGQSL